MREVQLRRAAPSPILVREYRGRWRTPFGPLVLFFYVAALALLGWFALSRLYVPVELMGSVHSPGRKLLRIILSGQIYLWFLLSPLVTCSQIAREREKGMLSGLVLTGMTPHEIVRNSWLTAVGFQFTLLLAPFPLWMLGPALGGVTPWEVLLAALLQIATVAAASALGLVCSAWEPTTFRAFIRTFVILLGYLLISLPFLSPEMAIFVSWCNPLCTMSAMLGSNSDEYLLQMGLLCSAILLVLVPILLNWAADGIRQTPLESPGAMEGAAPTTTWLTPPSGTRRVHRSARPLNAAMKIVRDPNTGERVVLAHRSRWEIYPIRDAIARREIRRRRRVEEVAYVPWVPQRTPNWPQQCAMMVCITALACGLGLWLRYIAAALPQSFAQEFLSTTREAFPFAELLLLTACIYGTWIGASTFTKEREYDTLGELFGLPLTSGQIVRGFVISAYWLEFGISPWAWALFPIAIFIWPVYLVLSWGFLAISLITVCTSIGMLFSWVSSHTNLAMGAASAVLAGGWYAWGQGWPQKLLILPEPARTSEAAFLQQLNNLSGDAGLACRYVAAGFCLMLLALGILGMVANRFNAHRTR